ncbi:DUF4840 domain-containing protein [Elizabethkingia bruuniana]|uniref:DUF4840 domain-containing protein n=1 Tax=Elizabethkingia bruuniana TaxID=1756149 RepID=A0A7T7UY72_9FLAO|nr:DUF4840 domain-containing protein [Elizabethkingia bruuniana]KGO10902.1 hypothetical protein KS04_06450 [Elizabethkingia miricola]AQX84908.1 hypothetical protein AYC65_07750 [Elizabethkingia bruuniana]KUY28908.1 hypothetical protein ATB97_01920 [Elizabethkingia bruuniana]OPB70538.1 hypothetical protein BAY12_18030 [Elizabethkingia bruuniana]QQN58387.1 DUF4840 domain-containing protein [Elizabethkingia bruuniana]
MKKFINLKAFLQLVILLSIPFILSNCRSDNDKRPNPVPGDPKVEDVNGSYAGKLGISQGTTKSEINVSFTAQKNVVSFTEFPMKEIISSIISDPTKANQALASIGKVKYEVSYTAVLSKSKKEVELTFSPKDLTFQVPIDGVNKKVTVTFAQIKQGIFAKTNTQNLNLELGAPKITVESTAVTPFNQIIYNFAMLKK